MEWQGEGVLIARRRHGESGAVIEVFTEAQGRHAGFVPGGAGRSLSPVLQPGAQLSLTWRARLAEQIGTFRVEPLRARAPLIFDDPPALAGLSAITAMLTWVLPERAPQPTLYARTVGLLDALGEPGWQAGYAGWELALLRETGFGPDLTRCAVTGARDGLAHVSPKSGRAVSAGAAGQWADRLLPLPGFLIGTGPAAPGDVARALALTGHFLGAWLGPALEREGPPPARTRLAELIARQDGSQAGRSGPGGGSGPGGRSGPGGPEDQHR